MSRHIVPLALIALLLVLLAQLLLGRGSLSSVTQMRNQLQIQKQKNEQAQLANQRLMSEVQDLKVGLEMVEERARLELGMVKTNEIYVHIAK
ncbi:MAG: septum formation initiator family protein [Burkholderiaceae bacterium]